MTPGDDDITSIFFSKVFSPFRTQFPCQIHNFQLILLATQIGIQFAVLCSIAPETDEFLTTWLNDNFFIIKGTSKHSLQNAIFEVFCCNQQLNDYSFRIFCTHFFKWNTKKRHRKECMSQSFFNIDDIWTIEFGFDSRFHGKISETKSTIDFCKEFFIWLLKKTNWKSPIF